MRRVVADRVLSCSNGAPNRVGSAHPLDEALRVLAPSERLDGIAERVIRARAIEDHEHGQDGSHVVRFGEIR